MCRRAIECVAANCIHSPVLISSAGGHWGIAVRAIYIVVEIIPAVKRALKASLSDAIARVGGITCLERAEMTSRQH